MNATEEHTNMEDDQSQVVFVLETQLEFWQKIDAIRLYGFSTIYEENDEDGSSVGDVFPEYGRLSPKPVHNQQCPNSVHKPVGAKDLERHHVEDADEYQNGFWQKLEREIQHAESTNDTADSDYDICTNDSTKSCGSDHDSVLNRTHSNGSMEYDILRTSHFGDDSDGCGDISLRNGRVISSDAWVFNTENSRSDGLRWIYKGEPYSLTHPQSGKEPNLIAKVMKAELDQKKDKKEAKKIEKALAKKNKLIKNYDKKTGAKAATEKKKAKNSKYSEFFFNVFSCFRRKGN